MKLLSLIFAASTLSVGAFGFNAKNSVVSKNVGLQKPALVSPLRTDSAAASSALFRDPKVTRGGAVPGWAAYNDALEEKPLLTKALTSLVGWCLGDLLAQVRYHDFTSLEPYLPIHSQNHQFSIPHFFFINVCQLKL